MIFLEMSMAYWNKRFYFTPLGILETEIYKGIAIVMIMMHNFLHWLPPQIGENEHNFDLKRVEIFGQILIDTPQYIFQSLISFWGHYGVQIFIFLSAYGLSKRYAKEGIVYWSFLRVRVTKVYLPFLFSLIVWFGYSILMHESLYGAIASVQRHSLELFYKLTLVSNFIPGELYTISGPWWFLSFIVQVYVVFPFVKRLFEAYGIKALIALSLGSLVLAGFLAPYLKISLAATVLVHIPELALGIYMASRTNFSLSYGVIGFVILVFVVSNFDGSVWYLGFVSALIVQLIVLQGILRRMRGVMTDLAAYIGSISIYIFYINGFMRTPWVVSAKGMDSWLIHIILCLVFVVCVVCVASLMDIVTKRWRKL
jgi:peptidoglycan/LPS O-acetylase OafA/YrhL